MALPRNQPSLGSIWGCDSASKSSSKGKQLRKYRSRKQTRQSRWPRFVAESLSRLETRGGQMPLRREEPCQEESCREESGTFEQLVLGRRFLHPGITAPNLAARPQAHR